MALVADKQNALDRLRVLRVRFAIYACVYTCLYVCPCRFLNIRSCSALAPPTLPAKIATTCHAGVDPPRDQDPGRHYVASNHPIRPVAQLIGILASNTLEDDRRMSTVRGKGPRTHPTERGGGSPLGAK